MARLFGVGVDTFSLGFGPKLYKKRMGDTEYCLSMIPLGGYVKMVGEDPGSDIDDVDIARSFTHKSVLKKILIVAAGPVANFLLAVVIFYFIFQLSGVYLIKPVVGQVNDGTPAWSAGLKPGDTILGIGDQGIESWDDMVEIIGRSGGKPLALFIDRDGRNVAVTVKPEKKDATNIFGEDIEKYLIGISAAGEGFHKSLNPLQAFGAGLQKTWEIIELTLLSIGKIFKGTVSANTLGGPIMIAQMAGEQARAGMANFSFFIALISINLGIINLFPVPVLDGGHILFFSIEVLTGKVLGEKIREKANQVGIVLLVALMVFAFYNDILRLFNGG